MSADQNVPSLAELTAEGPVLEAIDVYAEAIKLHRRSLTEATSEAVGRARQKLIEAHLNRTRRAVGLAEAMRALETERDAWKAHAFFWKDKAQAAKAETAP